MKCNRCSDTGRVEITRGFPWYDREAISCPDCNQGIEHIPEDVRDLFLKTAFELRNSGWESYSARAIFHRMRWHMRVEKGVRDYKINNNWSAPLSRWAMRIYPEKLGGFFETRERSEAA